MNLFNLAFKQIKAKPLSSCLNIILFTSGVAIISLIILFKDSFEKQMDNNARGIDLVVGAKGSPLQLILSGIYHVDYPTGNISYEEAKNLANNPLIKSVIPMALGDNYKGYRIVGTSTNYISLYDGEIQEGEVWNKPMQAVIGARVARQSGLKLHDTFSGTHGLIEGIGHVHDDVSYNVVGIMAENGSVLDQLILTSIESVWEIHGIHAHHDHGEEYECHHHHDDHADHHHHHDHDCDHEHGEDHHHETKQELEITTMLISYKSPMGAITLPRMINQSTNMQAASPAIEINRLYSLLGVGIKTLNTIAGIIILISAFSIFISLLNSLKERKYELALMRVMGGTRMKLFSMVILEGLCLSFIGYTTGFIVSRLGIWCLSYYAESRFHYDFSQWINIADVYLLSLSLLIGVISAIIPAVKVMKMDISKTLSE